MVFRCTFTSPIFFSFHFVNFVNFFVCLLFSFTSSVFLFFAYYTVIWLKRFSEMIETLLFRLLLYISSLYWYSRFSFNAFIKDTVFGHMYIVYCIAISIVFDIDLELEYTFWDVVYVSFNLTISSCDWFLFYARDFGCALWSIQCFIFVWLGSSSDPVSMIFHFQRTISLIFVIIVQWYQMLSFVSDFNVYFMFLTPRCSVFIISILLIIIKQYTVDEQIKTKKSKERSSNSHIITYTINCLIELQTPRDKIILFLFIFALRFDLVAICFCCLAIKKKPANHLM